MLPEIITFNKTLQYRLNEYEQLLDNVDTPCSEVLEIWASIFEDLVVMGVNWKALWVLSEHNCNKYDLLFPSAVIVKVNEFNWQDLVARVSVLAVQEDIVIPSELEVPIVELHPIKNQEYDETDLKDIEDWLDKCRYFFRNLWYPWDAKLDVRMMDWCDSHLKNRLKMQYDLKNGVFDKVITNYIRMLLTEAQTVDAIEEENWYNEDERLVVAKKYIQRKIIKAELDLFEEPDLRYGMILLKRKEKNFRSSIERINREAKFIWKSGSCESLINHLKQAQAMLDENTSIKVCGSLQEALNTSDVNDLIILPPGVHVMSMLRGIENGGYIKGFDKTESSIVPDMSSIPRAILLECFGSVHLENLSISKPSGIVIQIFDGTLRITDCRISSPKNSSTSRGIVVISGCKLFLERCELEGFGTAIVLQEGTHLTMTESKITNCYEGIKVSKNVSLDLERVEISHCSTFGIRMDLPELDSEVPLVGDLNLINQNNLSCQVRSDFVTFSHNNKGNVIIKKPDKNLDLGNPEEDDPIEVIQISDEENLEYDIDEFEMPIEENL